MKFTSWRVVLTQVLLGCAVALCFFVLRGVRAANEKNVLVTDWSHRHLLYSPPHSLLEQLRLSTHTRYIQQWMRKNVESSGSGKDHRGRNTTPAIEKDWNVYLGNGATVGAGVYPAKVYFLGLDQCNSPGVSPDFVVYNTNLAGADTPVGATVSGTFTAEPGLNSTITITNGGSSITLTATAGSTSGGNYRRNGVLATDASQLALAINRVGLTAGVSATNNNATVTVTATLGGTAGNSITVNAQANSNFAWTFSHLVDGASGVPTIAAFDNLYSGCSGTVPSSYWAYNTGTGSTAATSVASSRTGDQFAFVQNDGGGNLVLLKWAADGSTVNNPTDLTLSHNVPNLLYRNCTAPCMTTIALNGGATAYTSAPFVDYDHDTIYVGDDNGYLHQITGAFYGNPAETVVTGADVWPAPVSVGNVLTGPIYDDFLSSPQVFVCDSAGFLYRVDATIGGGTSGIVTSFQMAAPGFGIDDTPILDVDGTAVAEGVTPGLLYVFSRLDNAANNGGTGYNGPAVFDIAAEFAPNDFGSEVSVSTDGTPPAGAFFAGAFDNAYWQTGSGNLYVCSTSNTSGSDVTALWQISLDNEQTINNTTVGPSLTSANVQCSPITEFPNGETDRMFVSVTANPLSNDGTINCPSAATGCLMSFDITNPATWRTSTATAATAAVAGGASGVVVDNDDNISGGGSQIYFTPLENGNCTTVITTTTGQGIGGCAIQASQTGLN